MLLWGKGLEGVSEVVDVVDDWAGGGIGFVLFEGVLRAGGQVHGCFKPFLGFQNMLGEIWVVV